MIGRRTYGPHRRYRQASDLVLSSGVAAGDPGDEESQTDDRDAERDE